MVNNKDNSKKDYGEITTVKTIRLTVVNKVPKDESKAMVQVDEFMTELIGAIKKLGVDNIETLNEKRFVNLDSTNK